MLAQIIKEQHSPGWWVLAVLIGIAALYVFVKFEHAIIRLVAGLISLVLIVALVFWLFARH